MKKNEKLLLEWEEITNGIVEFFIEKYFDKPEWFWVGDEIGGILCVNDYFFDLDRILDCIRFNATAKQLFEFSEVEVEYRSENKPMITNFKNFVKYKIDLK